MLTDHKNNGFQKKLIVQNTNIRIRAPSIVKLAIHSVTPIIVPDY